MAKGKAQAQAVAQKQASINGQESYQLVQCLVRVSVYHVCWMRGLFPEESFSGHELSQLDKMHIKVLKPQEGDEEASTLQKWVEQGVMHAVRQGYLKNMYFGIAQDAAATHLLEEYIYSFKYGEDGITFEVNASSRGKAKDKFSSADAKKQPPNVNEVRFQVVRLMRMLVQVCQTLDQVPDERYLFIKLTYHDHTPEEYEPPYFHAVREDGIGHFSRRPFSMDVGSMDTRHHTVSVRIKSVLDSCDDQAGDDAEMQELEGSQQMSGLMMMEADEELQDEQQEQQDDDDGADAAAAAAAGGLEVAGRPQRKGKAKAGSNPGARTADASQARDQADELLLEQHDGHGMEPTLAPPASLGADAAAADADAAADAAEPEPSADETCGSADELGKEGGGDMQLQQQQLDKGGEEFSPAGSCGQAYETVRDYCLARTQVNFLDVLGCFGVIPEEKLCLVFEGLQREGLLQATPGSDGYTYTVLQQDGAKPPAPHQDSQAVDDQAMEMDANADMDADVAADEAVVAAAEGAGGVSDSWQGPGSGNMRVQHQQQEQQISQMMTGLSMGGGGRGGAAAAGARGINASVLGKDMHAGSLVSGLPNHDPTAPHQADDAAAEPSVQQGGPDNGQQVWFEASQQSLARVKGGKGAAAARGGAGAAAAPRQSRLRKASYVNNPIYQSKQQQAGVKKHTRKEATGSRLAGRK